MSKDLSALEMILDKLREHDKEFVRLRDGQTEIKETLATHEERSLNQHKRIERIEKITGGITLALVGAILAATLSGCGFMSAFQQKAPTTTEPTPKVDVVARAVANTVALATPDGDRFCSGVATEGAILTAHHCVSDGDDFKILFQGGLYDGVVIRSDVVSDLAIVAAIGARLKDTVPLATKAPVLGAKVVWMGYPVGLNFILGTGVVGNPAVLIGGVEFLAVYGQFIPGNSGGPVFNSKGELVGIVSMTMFYNGNYLPVGYAIPLATLKGAL
jgi:S1-C subfamily serine protease